MSDPTDSNPEPSPPQEARNFIDRLTAVSPQIAANPRIQEIDSKLDLAKKTTSLRVSDIDARIAPQRETASALLKTLEKTTDETWEQSFCLMVQTVLDDKETDALLKHLLLRKILAVGCQGSLCLQNGLGYAGILKDSNVPSSVNWVDPDSAQGAKNRTVAEAELGNLPSFAEVQKDVDKEWHSLGAAIGTELICVGWLRRNSAGEWHCITKAGCPALGKLVTVRAAQGDGPKSTAAIFAAVGRLDGGKSIIDPAAGPALAEGRPVFVANRPSK